MAYIINHYNNSPLILNGLLDGTIDTSTSLTLVGRDTPSYGRYINENFVYLLENFSGSTTPSNPLTGQLWWDSNNQVLKVNAGTTFNPAWVTTMGANSAPSSSPPTTSARITGDGTLWYDTTNQQLNIWSGSSWVTVGPVATPSTGQTGTFPGLITDTSGISRVVVEFQINGVTFAIFAKDTFATTITGFTNISPGLNFSSATPLGLSNQAVSSLQVPQSLSVQNLTAVQTVQASSIKAASFGSVSGTATFSGQFNGNLTGYSISGMNSIQSSAFTATTGFQGNVLTPNQPFITTLGNVTINNIAYSPAATSNWNSPIPSTVAAALDQLAARLRASGH
jgi:hypothetical protein